MRVVAKHVFNHLEKNYGVRVDTTEKQSRSTGGKTNSNRSSAEAKWPGEKKRSRRKKGNSDLSEHT